MALRAVSCTTAASSDEQAAATALNGCAHGIPARGYAYTPSLRSSVVSATTCRDAAAASRAAIGAPILSRFCGGGGRYDERMWRWYGQLLAVG